MADEAQLVHWLTEWSLSYDFKYDQKLKKILFPMSRCFSANDLKVILDWKLNRRWNTNTDDLIDKYVLANPGAIEHKSANAMEASDDGEALIALQGLPKMKTANLVGVRSSVLMCLDPTRWPVMDKNSNAALVCLRDTIKGQANRPYGSLAKLADQLSAYNPKINSMGSHVPSANDWPHYVSIYRSIAELSLLSLRTIDRALYCARDWIHG
jgi:hypothetical protein